MTDFSGQYFGRYYLADRLGEGGMAVVYKAYDTRLERDIAIKVIRSEAFPINALDEVLKRFEREAKSLAKLSHPNIVKVYDYGEHEGSPFLVMEYLPGGTMTNLLGKPIPWQDAVKLILPIARSVAYAHQRGVLHRDIKPANVLITESGEPMLSDFGIAKLFIGEQTTALTESGMAIGTPEYMAPEQWTGNTSPYSDQYSLGIMLYELVTGRKPYVADTPGAILIKQVTEPLPSPGKFVAGLPESVEHVLIKALAREPENRYKNVDVFVTALEDLRVGAPISAGIEEREIVQETQISPQQDSVISIPTQLPLDGASETSRSFDVVDETQKVEEPPSSQVPARQKSKSIKLSRRGAGIMAGVIVVVLAALIGLPFFVKQISPETVGTTQPTAISTITFQSVAPSAITEEATLPTVTIVPAVTQLPAEITDGRGVEMVLVPEGEFIMGSGEGDSDGQPIHGVYLDAYYIDRYEVTNALYKACVDSGVCKLPADIKSNTRANYYTDPEFENYPVIYIDWNRADTYCEWRDAGLPTEAQWEKAARGTDGRTYPWGEGIDCSKANYRSCVGDTEAVGSYEAGKSPYGVYDMAGNVEEWVADWYGESYYANSSSANPMGPESGQYRVLRGGSWFDVVDSLRTVARNHAIPDNSGHPFGFRCARSATLEAQPVAIETSSSDLTDIVSDWYIEFTSNKLTCDLVYPDSKSYLAIQEETCVVNGQSGLPQFYEGVLSA